jgi:hypothetical protein
MSVNTRASLSESAPITVREVDPIHDRGWIDMVERHPWASVFHTPGWLEALRRTYGYEPLVLTTSPPSHTLDNGLVACSVSSWLTGKRIVSLPFSDHCQPLVDSNEALQCLLKPLLDEQKNRGWKYVEIRPAPGDLVTPPGFSETRSFCLHRLDLGPSLSDLFGKFHKDCVQRKISRAEREGVVYEEGRSASLLEQFYHLMVLTRRRQMLIPQPLIWFRNLIACMGESLQLHVASKQGHPVAAMLTLEHKSTVVYKYGCSHREFSNLGGTQLLFWRAIKNAKARGFLQFDLGRSDWDNTGLIRFKDRWGAARSTLTYWRHGAGAAEHAAIGSKNQAARRLLGHMPEGTLSRTGALIYRHLG